MTAEEKKLCAHRVFTHFYQICQIPHGSGDEQALSDFLRDWARGLGLEVTQDACRNVWVRKPAYPGWESAPGVMLQAHMDMVCVKAPGVEHDFHKDPIDWVIEGNVLSTGGKTTLGADDGIGVALAMAVLEDPQLPHPALEVLFTTKEEDDFSGALGFDVSQMRASYLINLDHTVAGELVCGSCGGMQVDVRIPVQEQPIPEGWQTCCLSVGGLRGGHSGEDIHRGRGNAIVLLGRLLLALEACGPFLLAQIQGGSLRTAIAREAQAVVCLPQERFSEGKARLDELAREMEREFAESGSQLTVTFQEIAPVQRAWAPGKVISALTLFPDGIFQMNEVLTGLVDTSVNMGEVYFQEGELHTVHEIRSAQNSLGIYLRQRLERLAQLLGGESQWSNPYPGWAFDPKSGLTELCSRVYERLYGKTPRCFTVHAGLEVGCFLSCCQGVQAVSLGPDYWDYHAPTESVDIESVKQTYRYLTEILRAFRDLAKE